MWVSDRQKITSELQDMCLTIVVAINREGRIIVSFETHRILTSFSLYISYILHFFSGSGCISKENTADVLKWNKSAYSTQLVYGKIWRFPKNLRKIQPNISHIQKGNGGSKYMGEWFGHRVSPKFNKLIWVTVCQIKLFAK